MSVKTFKLEDGSEGVYRELEGSNFVKLLFNDGRVIVAEMEPEESKQASMTTEEGE